MWHENPKIFQEFFSGYACTPDQSPRCAGVFTGTAVAKSDAKPTMKQAYGCESG
jgi:hypothetical protein